MPDEEFRPGAHDLETPFIFVPHGAPDPVEWKRQHPGWVSFPATFVPHPRPIPKWKVINGQRWSLDKKGRPWPRTRYGRPTCPFDELPPGMPAPGTQYELMRKLENPMLFFGDEPMPTVEEFSLLAARLRAERAAAAPPPPPQPKRAYDGDGLGPVRDYMNAMRTVDQQLRKFAAAARQEIKATAAWKDQQAAGEALPGPHSEVSAVPPDDMLAETDFSSSPGEQESVIAQVGPENGGELPKLTQLAVNALPDPEKRTSSVVISHHIADDDLFHAASERLIVRNGVINESLIFP